MDYQLHVELRADGLREDDRQLLGPRLASNLTGRAFDAISEIDREKLRAKDGWKYLLEYLEGTRGKQKVDLLGDSFAEFFMSKTVYRRDGEELSEYVPRFRAQIRRLEKALADSKVDGKMPSEVFGSWVVPAQLLHADGAK